MADEEKDNEITPGPFEGKKIELASQDEVESFQYELEDLLDVIGHPEALITDLSSIRDFFWKDQDGLNECMIRIGAAFTIDVSDPNERLVDLAKRVRKARKG